MRHFPPVWQTALRSLRNEVRSGQPSSSRRQKHPPGYEKTIKLLEARNTPERQSLGSPKDIQKLFAEKRAKQKLNGLGFDRVIKSPKLHTIKSVRWLILPPFLKKVLGLFTTKQVDAQQPRSSSRLLKGGRMRSYVQFLTTPTADTPGTTLLLHFDDKRYIIGNVGEGTQRACVQRKIGMSKVENILLTGKTNWASNGGILGLILTIADVITTKAASRKENPKVKKDRHGDPIDEMSRRLRIYGTENLTHLFATARRFVFRKGMPLDIVESENKNRVSNADVAIPSWADDNIQVWAMDVVPEEQSGQTSRKRSHEEISEDDNTDGVMSLDGKIGETSEETADRYAQVRKGVVGHMFESDWQLDALTPLKLSKVAMPAAVFVRNEAGRIEKYTGPLPGGGEVVPDIDVLVRNPWPGAMVRDLPPTKPSKLARSYIVKNYPQRGKFNPKAAIDLGVKPGISFRTLAQGDNVTTAAGTVVTPEMVMSPDKVGGAFAVVELPSADYIDGLVNREEWSSEKVMEGVGAIVWILGKGVLADEKMADFRTKYNHLKHIISSVDCCPNNLAFESVAMAELKLHLIDSERFPVPAYTNELPNDVTKSTNWVKARVGEMIQLEPSFKLIEDNVVPHFDAAKALLEHPVQGDPVEKWEFDGVNKEVLELARAARIRINDPEYLAKIARHQEDIPCKDAELITLGTGSALPSKYRNVSATLLRVPGVGNYLFDCGENTLGQLKRVFGAELPEILRGLKVIWISHLHADHHLGTASVLKAWHEETCQSEETKSKSIIVASDTGMLQWLSEYSQVEEIGYSRVNSLIMDASNNWSKEFDNEETEAYGLSAIVACPVSHCNGALAVVLKFPNGFKVAFSGDCRPSLNFAKIGQDATVLIHEATFDNELQGDAMAKKHCTTAEALWVAKKMRARRVLLTHFSQRYQKIPSMDDAGDHIAIVAFDYMRCKVGDFAKIAEYRPALVKLYEDEADDE